MSETRTIHGEDLTRDERALVRFVHNARFGPALLPKGRDWEWAKKVLDRFERRGVIYYTKVDGKKCHRLLTAHGARILDDIKKVGDFDY
jgi:hypothetical protein